MLELGRLPRGYEHLTPEMCLACKGARALCGKPCLWLARIDERLPKMRLDSQDLFGSSPPSVFVGRHGYPNVNVGPMLPPVHLEDRKARELDTPSMWLDRRIEDVIGLRSALVRTRRPLRVNDARQPPRILQVTQELARAERPVDTEVHLRKRPNVELTLRLGDMLAPMGPSVESDRVRLAENPRVGRAVERATGDEDARAARLMSELYRAGVATDQIEKLLSVGLLGHAADRKLVPTRWSITATDDQVGLGLRERVLDFATLDGVHWYEGVAHGNRFYVLMTPGPWSFDMIEVWLKGATWTLETSDWIEDHEGPDGRRRYASNITGAYYAARLAVLEKLVEMRRQASVFVYREITPDYWAPLGVWVIREGVRRLLRDAPKIFPDLATALEHGRTRTLRQGWDRRSWLIDDLLSQRRLHEYLA